MYGGRQVVPVVEPTPEFWVKPVKEFYAGLDTWNLDVVNARMLVRTGRPGRVREDEPGHPHLVTVCPVADVRLYLKVEGERIYVLELQGDKECLDRHAHAVWPKYLLKFYVEELPDKQCAGEFLYAYCFSETENMYAHLLSVPSARKYFERAGSLEGWGEPRGELNVGTAETTGFLAEMR